MRPLVIVLVAIGVLAFGAAAVATGQVVLRTRDRWRTDNDRLRTLGMARRQILMVELATAGVVAALALATALVAMVLASPLAPIGPLHDFDPGQGFGIDVTVAVVGAVVVVATILLLTVALSSVRITAAPPDAATIALVRPRSRAVPRPSPASRWRCAPTTDAVGGGVRWPRPLLRRPGWRCAPRSWRRRSR